MSSEELKPGQKFPTPTPGVGDRVFYESLLKQRPDSVMAQEWCISYGVLSHKKSAKLYKIVTERKRQIRLNGGAMVASPKKKKAKLIKEEGAVPEIQSSGGDGVGVASL
mmetsp:Transcript_7450/g.21812  ORF Transcript_7450/g.21812 Transcript_7450/m.21812 type:complete len:109 (-) Transcript_7450:173-499(-)|eukprot:CAMPEP_0119563058 /NCGR_PEP_ID=MMETSP1352-20130426/22364_1 /TAXON_ID=265584 /ORGANISM="Stauroneis constricta, Strain CCMP1120" /LENGTH=108 /DNA_ID=CAMNT_0007611595 /DNA_START=82 /DNA_END=408 /DNA_ORIENTATION=+